jgi:hypothetical protein
MRNRVHPQNHTDGETCKGETLSSTNSAGLTQLKGRQGFTFQAKQSQVMVGIYGNLFRLSGPDLLTPPHEYRQAALTFRG